MAARDKDERAEIASLAAHARWARTTDRKAATAAARDALLASFEAPAEVTDPAQRQSMFDHAMSEHMIKMRRARRSRSQARRQSEDRAGDGDAA